MVSDQGEQSFTGVWPGRIAHEERGGFGHGYDPVFIPDGFEVTAAELPPEIKNSMSHRAMALQQLISALASGL
jgi:XTP/dITP diphosphohydrolase